MKNSPNTDTDSSLPNQSPSASPSGASSTYSRKRTFPDAPFDHIPNDESPSDSAQSLYYDRTLLDTPPLSSSSLESNHLTSVTNAQSPVNDSPVANSTNAKSGIRNYVIGDLTDDEPTHSDHEHLRFNAPEIFYHADAKGAHDRYSLNWLNVAELLANKKCLDPRARDLLRMYVKSKWDTVSWLENGLKSTNGKLSQAILLLIAAEAWSIVPNAYTIIESNLINKDGKYSPKGCKRRFISPRAARGQIHKFKTNYAPERLFPRHHAYLVLFESSEELRKVGHNPAHQRADYDRFFSKNRQSLIDWKRSGKIRAYFLSHEITCLSILDQTFNPHSHAVIWVDAESDASFIDEFTEAGELIKYLDTPRTGWADLKNYLYYMMRAHSLAKVYEREFSLTDPVSFNKSTINALHTLVELQCGDGGGQGKQKLFKAGIPMRKRK